MAVSAEQNTVDLVLTCSVVEQRRVSSPIKLASDRIMWRIEILLLQCQH